MNSRSFKTLNDLELKIKNRKSAVILEIDMNKDKNHFQFWLEFAPNVFAELINYIESIAVKSWSALVPKEADSLGADYHEYYDREFDNNGYLSLKQNGFFVERPSLESGKLYQFNKRKMESFIYDIRRMIEGTLK